MGTRASRSFGTAISSREEKKERGGEPWNIGDFSARRLEHPRGNRGHKEARRN